MIIYDDVADKSLESIIILLTKREMMQLAGYLEDLSTSVDQEEHYHLCNDDFSKEITLALYDKSKGLKHFAEKYRELIIMEKS